MTYGGFSVPFANKIADIIDAVETGDQYLAESDFRVSQRNTYYVVLDEDLAAPDDKSTPTTAVATVYKPGVDGTVGADGYSSTPHKLDVVNRFTGYSASEGDFIVVEEQDGEYRPAGAGGSGCSCCEFIDEHDITLTTGAESRSLYPITVTEPPGRLNSVGDARIWLEPGVYIARYNATGSINADGREGWYVPYSSLSGHVYATVVATGDPVETSNISGIVAKLYIVLRNTDFEGDEPKTTLHIELDATVDTTPIIIDPPESPP